MRRMTQEKDPDSEVHIMASAPRWSMPFAGTALVTRSVWTRRGAAQPSVGALFFGGVAGDRRPSGRQRCLPWTAHVESCRLTGACPEALSSL